jgi:thymidylate kinase
MWTARIARRGRSNRNCERLDDFQQTKDKKFPRLVKMWQESPLFESIDNIQALAYVEYEHRSLAFCSFG